MDKDAEMKLVNFKLITIVCEPDLKNSVLALSQNFGATGFTISLVSGQGNGEKSSGEIPDSKIKIEIILDSSAATALMQSLADSFFANYSVIVYCAEISVLRPEKFESSP